MLSHLTQQRLATVRHFFRTKDDDDLLGCYAWAQAVSSGLLPILGDFEITLRNALHRSLSLHYSNQQADSFNWMIPRPNPAPNPLKPFITPLHRMAVQSIQNVQSVITKKPAATPDDIVAALPFGFWENLIASLDHVSHSRLHPNLQYDILSAAFPHAPLQQGLNFGDPQFKQDLTNLLYRIRDIRNRVGHHDAIWRIPEFNSSGAVGFTPRHPRHTVISIAQAINKIAWLAGWIDPAIPVYMQRTSHWSALKALLTRQALATYRFHGGCKSLHLESPGKMRRSKPEGAKKIVSRIKQRKLNSYHF
ncbi:hypothetical protein [Aeromonas caviae]|uniref:hypothetical protein n=1 Tax=Aeromonas caviae TaxID=648 RepID=UPI002B4870D9|nr:hypothetical protein [Aeromonas caviae]